MFRPLVTLSVLVIGGLLTACNNEKEVPAPTLATLTGQVSVVDELAQPTTAAGVIVTVGSGAQQRTTTTDATGAYRLADLPAAKYTLVFTRPDVGTLYAPVELSERQLSATRNVELGQTSSTRVNSLTFQGMSTIGASQAVELENSVTYDARLYPDGYFANMYFGDSPTVSSSNYKIKFGSGANVNPARSAFSVSSLRAAGFASGTTVYAISYGAAKRDIRYEATVPANAPNGVTSNLNVTPSNVVSFTMP
ncbi:carboxypeptidase-like regulatory domain-containing protein [Hymenobacter yonginensis]|uniref:Carboxypeptidase-like regulatory domain-containing protein n=1 Tax=Hymenobacter yonginensis TaxID=748197 RepID=A0ABY7PQJ1_9BACT|nr:carboxypeptidase-like regulatory domain-containing protein [Hymenobacter yonginensis]WBO84563.1 carboxypeptidase-like regulatory domain-containing protein [Hymenobacter yonginensis]